MGDYSTSRIDDLPQLWDGFGKLVRKGLGGLVEGVRRRDPVGEPDPVRLAPVDHLAGHDQLLRVAQPDDRRQP